MDREKKIRAILDEISDMTDRIRNDQREHSDEEAMTLWAKKVYGLMKTFEDVGFTEKQAFTLLCTVVNCSLQMI